MRNDAVTPLADAQVRSRALDPTRSFHLEAPAGSGKTSVLTARFLSLLAVVEHPQQILALTFTNKAAGEMRERITRALRWAAEGRPPVGPQEEEIFEIAARAIRHNTRHKDLLEAGEILRIQTFHAFCYSIVSQAPLEAGIVPGSTLLVEPDQVLFLREVVEETLTHIMELDAGDALRRAMEKRLLYLNNSWRSLATELEELVQRRDALKELIGVLDREKVLDYLLGGFREIAEAELAQLRWVFLNSPLGESWDGLLRDLEMNRAELCDTLPREIPGARWEALGSWQAMASAFLTQGGDPRRQFGLASKYYSGFGKTDWARLIQGMGSSLSERLKHVRELPVAEMATPDIDTLWDLVLLVGAVVEAYEKRCRAQHLIDFVALEAAALRLFNSADPSDLQLLLDQRIRHVLVDEFQDTSRRQWDLLQRICCEWLPGDGRTLFLVGDPKQSIYGFRKAEVKLFMEARKGLPQDSARALPLESLAIGTNFRSEPRLIHWCNDLFGRTVMVTPREEVDEVPFTPSVPPPDKREDSPHGKVEQSTLSSASPSPELALFVGWPDGVSARKREADYLACRIAAHLLDCGKNSRVGILLFARTHLSIYLEALQQRGVPVQVTEGLKLIERPEVQYLWQLCRALVFPQDHFAWATQLRSPWLCLSYRELLAVHAEEPDAWVEKIHAYTQRDDRVEAFWDRLLDARRHMGHEPLADVVESAWLSLGGARTTGQRWGTRGLACCRQFIALLRESELHEPVQTLLRVERLLDYAYEPVDPDAAHSSVSLMTVHRAKGLEFDAVVLPFLDWGPLAMERREQPAYLLQRSGGPGERYLLAARPDRRKGDPDPMYRLLHRLHLDRRWGESKRLFYVAVSRARRRLFLSGTLPWPQRGRPLNIPSQSPLSWLNAHYGLTEALMLHEFARPAEDCVEIPEGWRMRWQSDATDFQAFVEPLIHPLEAVSFMPDKDAPFQIQPAAFERETASFIVQNPSTFPSLEEAPGIGYTEEPAKGDAPCDHRVWGTVIHRLLETYARQRALPSPEAIEGFLRHVGAAHGEAAGAAQLALSEVKACIEDPWLKRFLESPSQQLQVELPLEAMHSERTLYAGVLDLVACVEMKWWLVDFKTSRPSPGEHPESFMRAELERYRPQLRAYREMWAKTKGVEERDIETAVYWTAMRQWERC